MEYGEWYENFVTIPREEFICDVCSIPTPAGQKFTRHGFPKTLQLCYECYRK